MISFNYITDSLNLTLEIFLQMTNAMKTLNERNSIFRIIFPLLKLEDDVARKLNLI